VRIPLPIDSGRYPSISVSLIGERNDVVLAQRTRRLDLSGRERQGSDERAASPSSAARSPSFLVGLGHRQLGRRHRLEALVGDRLSTLDRKAVGPAARRLLGPLD
jgi:hypothetical protein